MVKVSKDEQKVGRLIKRKIHWFVQATKIY